jgi:hypothetical protein
MDNVDRPSLGVIRCRDKHLTGGRGRHRGYPRMGVRTSRGLGRLLSRCGRG